MSQKTKIAWANHSTSPWFGCSRVDEACRNCYAEQLTLRNGWAGWGDKAPRVRSKGFWKNVFVWDRIARREGVRRRTFTSLMDWLDPKVPIGWLGDFLKVIYETPNLDHLLLTKRPELFRGRMDEVMSEPMHERFYNWLQDFRWRGVANVWSGITCGTQASADERIPILLSIPAKVRWLSVEPILEAIALDPHWLGAGGRSGSNYQMPQISWVVIGGESGYNRREAKGGTIEAITDIAQQCKAAGVPCFVKQDTALLPGQQGRLPDNLWAVKEFPK